ncbi:two-component system, OmpR family, sensor histidine kinase QseC [Duganella sp. CF517]|uniref:ATP-binding protein n=1 Tax=Duganella sp. CF517 TaxID=1881038 RepID=UPI0008B491C3|nr:ATP-binding protein [Duganella sp. CF517]SEO09182.1 two-component system, OmpR family, sensor histidine kinase QseC [Duganella sp. CF517]
MRARQPSLFGRLMTGFAGVLAAVTLVSFAYVVYEAKATQRVRTQAENRAHAHEALLHFGALARQPRAMLAAAAQIEAVRAHMFKSLDYRSRVRLRLWQGGRLVYNSAPWLPAALPAFGTPQARTASSWERAVVADPANGLVVERSHEVDDEWMLSLSALNVLMSSTVFSLPLLLLPAWLIVGIGLRPLRRIAELIEQRDEFDLAPLPDSNYRELSPLVSAINRLLARLSQRIEREHAFITDAAHELKTPLAAIQINAHLILSRCDAGVRERCAAAAAGLNGGVDRASHMVHQLLAFERASTESDSVPDTPMELASFLRGRIAAMAPIAVARRIDIVFEADAAPVRLLHVESMAALFDNLLSNAIKYAPDRSRIHIALANHAGLDRVTLTDEGPGIVPALRRRVFERFYRLPGQREAGSGLGLAIAQRAAERNKASIALADGPGGKGLCVRVDFPRKADG